MKPTDYIELGLHLKSTEKGYALLSVSYNLNTTTLSDNVEWLCVRAALKAEKSGGMTQNPLLQAVPFSHLNTIFLNNSKYNYEKNNCKIKMGILVPC